MAGDFTESVRPHLDALLEPGEALVGVVAATVLTEWMGRRFSSG